MPLVLFRLRDLCFFLLTYVTLNNLTHEHTKSTTHHAAAKTKPTTTHVPAATVSVSVCGTTATRRVSRGATIHDCVETGKNRKYLETRHDVDKDGIVG